MIPDSLPSTINLVWEQFVGESLMSHNLVQQLEKLWESSDSAPDVFEFLQQHGGPDASEILTVLLADQTRRWKTDQPLSVKDYLDAIPGLGSYPDIENRLVEGEIRARQIARATMTFDQLPTRTPGVDITRGAGPSAGSAVGDDSFELNSKIPGPGPSANKTATGDPRHAGRYRRVRLLGEGAFGRVYLAFDEELQRQVAVKVPTPERFRNPGDAEAYLAEARTVARLNHPNIVPVYDTGRGEDGSIFVVSRFIEGCTLAERFKQDPPGYEESAALLATVAQALDHAHQKGLIHRDVKPENILLEESTNTPYVADFGLAISEDNYLKQRRISGTPAYMSPEQARGEGHRLDRRSDVFSVGMVLFELLTGKKPFRGGSATELLQNIITTEPPLPQELDDSVPDELERICLKAMAKRASDRYPTAAALADDLLHWNQSPQTGSRELQIVPKGLRSFDAGDADFFLGLLPGPRNRNGLPDSIGFWKTRIEETDPDKTFSVGLVYGPSGCGKSSLVKAGLLPHLSRSVLPIYIEATPDETETRILRGLRKQIPDLPTESNLLETLTLLRRAPGRKVVLILDQFEQWLHAFRAQDGTELVSAMRQCDGGRLQAIAMVRDDFAMAAARFMDAVEVPIVQGENFATVDLFDLDHAEKVLVKFGQAFGKLPVPAGKLSDEQMKFVAMAASGLAQDGKVISVRLALFAEMVKGKPWVPATLDDVGGAEGIGVNFLEETFSSRTANPKHRLHQLAAREVLNALLPEVGSDIKGHMRSHAHLLEASGYQNQPEKFDELVRILDGELRLITPTDPEGFQPDADRETDSGFFQLTHDFLVSSLRDWLTRKQTETKKGRAELKLAERSAEWIAKPENRQLPSLLEWASIRMLTDKKKWNVPQRKLMERANRFHGIRSGIVGALLLALVFGGLAVRNSIAKNRLEFAEQKRLEQSEAEATRIVQGLLRADTSQVQAIIQENLPEFREWASDDLSAAVGSLPDESNGKLHAALAILDSDDSVLPFLKERLLTVSPVQFQHVRALLDGHKANLVADYREIALDRRQDANLRFRAACALAQFDPAGEQWPDGEFGSFVAGHLVAVLPSDLLPWRNELRPVKTHLVDHLASIFRDAALGEQVRSFATDTLADYLGDDAAGLFKLMTDSNGKQFETMFDKLTAHRERAVELGISEVGRILPVHGDNEDRDAHAMRQANAAVMLLRLNAPEQVWQLLKHNSDPLVRSYLVNWMIPRGADPVMIINRYLREEDVSVRRALLLALGEIDETRLPENVRDSFFEKLLGDFRSDSDSGLHSAALWLLKRSGRGEQIVAIETDLQQSEDKLVAGKDSLQQWYLNGRGQTFVILDADREFRMGSPETETGRSADEDLHRRRVGRTIAISATEVTLGQWREFDDQEMVFPPDQEQLRAYIPGEDSPMLAVTWYEAAHYCNWLSGQEGIPEDQWCYERNEDGEYGPGMKAKENFLECTGYRLPTEAEWEFACRAGSESGRYYGTTETLLSEYAWYMANGGQSSHPVGRLKPNDFGLFDVLGNAYEWCHDPYDGRQIDFGGVTEDVHTGTAIEASDRRVLRGASFRNLSPNNRSASRVADQPGSRVLNHGFRPVRTWKQPEDRR